MIIFGLILLSKGFLGIPRGSYFYYVLILGSACKLDVWLLRTQNSLRDSSKYRIISHIIISASLQE